MAPRQRWLRIGFGLVALLLFVAAFKRQASGDGWDFNAYHKAALRFWQMGSPYVFEKRYAFKYPPIAIPLFLPWAALPFEVARWIYTFCHALVACAIPWLLHRSLTRDGRVPAQGSAWLGACGISMLASLRFLDIEFQGSQFGLPILFLMVLGLNLLVRGRRWGLWLLAWGGWVKVHGLLALGALLELRRPRTWLVPMGCVLILGLLPWPPLFWDWVTQMRLTTPLLGMGRGAVNYQGFYPLSVWYLGFDSHSLQPLLLSLPFLLVGLRWLPGIQPTEAPRHAASLHLSAFCWALLGLMSSPLPWQYTYSVLWGFVVASWILGNAVERRWLLGIALFLGLSTKMVLGVPTAVWLERRQSVLWALVLLWGLLLIQARRWRQLENEAPRAEAA